MMLATAKEGVLQSELYEITFLMRMIQGYLKVLRNGAC